MVRFLAWLDREAPSGNVDEIGAAEALERFRADTAEADGMPLADLSFDTISGAGPNGAIVHYRVNRDTNRKLEPDSLYLVDSGAQYPDGTTDVTRTVAVGTPAPEARRAFTLVLKGNIALSEARFPKGTNGAQLDTLARQFLWKAGLDYDHGTGHGVGAYLSVHEGPARIAKTGNVALEPGMVLSNEPGFYKTGAFGIRIENLIVVTGPTPVEGGERPMLGFEILTLAPIDLRLVEPELLAPSERNWLNAYHARVRALLSPHLSPEDAAWLAAATAALT
jgi:Xaa-Pro aminopeptidase